MRLSSLCVLTACIVGCGSSTTTNDMQSNVDMNVGMSTMDMAGAATPYNMPGKVFCYNAAPCSTTSADPICCDYGGSDGGFVDTCVASAAACTALNAKAKSYACGQAADCGAGMICCGDIGMSKSGKSFIDSTTCAASCTGNLTQLCVTATECKTSGATCTAADISGREIGLCK